MYKDVRVLYIISMVVICNFIVSVGYDRRRLGLPIAPLHMDYDYEDNTIKQ